MKFYNYINESVRTKPISFEETKALIIKNCRKNFQIIKNKGSCIFRGVNNIDNYIIGDSNKGKLRKSANTFNYYTLLIDNSKYWKNYPKRSKSFICSTSHHTADGYGNVYTVIPYDNTPIGVCPMPDIWDSFSSRTINSLEMFNLKLRELFFLLNDYISWELLKSDINNTEIDLDNKLIRNNIFFGEYYNYKKSKFKSFTDYWEYYFQPAENNFELVTNINNLKQFREVWFQGKAIFIKENLIYKFLNEI